jgi:integrase
MASKTRTTDAERAANAVLEAVELPEGKADHVVLDTLVRGFGIRVRRLSGGRIGRSWIFIYRTDDGSARMGIGDADRKTGMTVVNARARASDLRRRVNNGEDPQGDKKQRREADERTLRHVIEQYLDQKSGRPNTMRTTRMYLEGPLGRIAKKEGIEPYLARLHNKPIHTITRGDISDRLLAVAKNSGEPSAGALKGAMSAFFRWSMEMGYVEHNPMIGALRSKKSPPRDRVLSNEELSTIWRALADDDYGRAMKLLALTGCRREEVGRMRWSEISEDGTTWTIPKERSKSKRAHSLPITPLMKSIIDTVPVRDGIDHLFGLKRGFTTWSKYKALLDEKLELPPWRIHDIRRSVSTLMNDLGVAPPHVIEKILGHTLGGTHGVYNKSEYPTEVRNAMLRWSTHISEITSDGSKRKIVPLRPAANVGGAS